MKNMRNGFTLIELMSTVSILAIGSVLAVPNIMQYMKSHHDQDASQILRSEMQEARQRAIQHKANINFHFNTTASNSNSIKDYYLSSQTLVTKTISKIQFDMLGQVKYNPALRCLDFFDIESPDIKLKIEINPKGDFQVVDDGSVCIV